MNILFIIKKKSMTMSIMYVLHKIIYVLRQ